MLSIFVKTVLILCKDNANREQKLQTCLRVMPRCSLSYAKIHIIGKFTNKRDSI